MQAIDIQNEKIMSKLVAIQRRSHSTPSLTLPALRKSQFRVPGYEQENNKIAQKIITSKPYIRTTEQLQRYKTLEERRRRISRYDSTRGINIDKKQYIAEQLLMKKLQNSRVSRVTNPEN